MILCLPKLLVDQRSVACCSLSRWVDRDYDSSLSCEVLRDLCVGTRQKDEIVQLLWVPRGVAGTGRGVLRQSPAQPPSHPHSPAEMHLCSLESLSAVQLTSLRAVEVSKEGGQLKLKLGAIMLLNNFTSL